MTKAEAVRRRAGLSKGLGEKGLVLFLKLCRCKGDSEYCELYFMQSAGSENALCETCLNEAAFMRARDHYRYLEVRDYGPADERDYDWEDAYYGRSVQLCGVRGPSCERWFVLDTYTSLPVCSACQVHFTVPESELMCEPSPRARRALGFASWLDKVKGRVPKALAIYLTARTEALVKRFGAADGFELFEYGDVCIFCEGRRYQLGAPGCPPCRDRGAVNFRGVVRGRTCLGDFTVLGEPQATDMPWAFRDAARVVYWFEVEKG